MKLVYPNIYLSWKKENLGYIYMYQVWPSHRSGCIFVSSLLLNFHLFLTTKDKTSTHTFKQNILADFHFPTSLVPEEDWVSGERHPPHFHVIVNAHKRREENLSVHHSSLWFNLILKSAISSHLFWLWVPAVTVGGWLLQWRLFMFYEADCNWNLYHSCWSN